MVFVAGGLAVSSIASAQPVITARLIPPANESGWNNSDVTVVFACRRATSCPEAVQVSAEGADWQVVRSVSDESGRTALVTATVNIDRTAPSVTIASPSDEALSDTGAVMVFAAASEFGSGIRAATCNGRAARVRDAAVTCEVRLWEGLNDVIVQVMDNAGNSGSTGVHVSRQAPVSSVSIVPEKAALLEGQARIVQLADAFGRTITHAAWQVSDPSVARIEQRGEEVSVTALGPGEVTVTARWEQFNAEARFTVVRGEKLPMGSTIWSVGPTPGFLPVHQIYTHPTAAGPDTLLIERETTGGRIALKAISQSPRVLWLESPALRADEAIVRSMGETFGGALFRVDGAGGRSSAIVRSGRPEKGRLWRYESAGKLATEFAQGWDGTVYAMETMAGGFPVFLGLDGATGVVKFRWPLPTSSQSVGARRCAEAYQVVPATAGSPTVPDGMVAAFSFVTFDRGDDGSACRPGRERAVQTLHLARVTSSGGPQVREVRRFTQSSQSGPLAISVKMVVPHYQNALLVPWTVTDGFGLAEHHVTRLEGESVADYSLPFLGEVGIGDDTAYTVTADGQTLVVFNAASGRVQYVRHASVGKIAVVMVTADGHLVTNTAGPLLDENYQPEARPRK